MFTVVYSEKGGSSKKLEFDTGSITVGRVQGNDIVLPKGNVSKRHARIEFKAGSFSVCDLKSTNGTYINGRKITEPSELNPGDKVYIGDFILTIEVPEKFEAKRTKTRGSLPVPAVKSGGADDAGPVSSLPRPSAKADDEGESASGAIISSAPIYNADEASAADRLSDLPRPSGLKPAAEIKAPAPARRRSSIPAPAAPKKKKESAHVAAPVADLGDPDLDEVVDRLFDLITLRVKRLARADVLPAPLDEGSAGQVRLALKEIIESARADDSLPHDLDMDVVAARVFKKAVELGPLAAWIDDDKIEQIRVHGADDIYLFSSGKWERAELRFDDDDEVAEVIRRLFAGLEERQEVFGDLRRCCLERGHLALAGFSPVSGTRPFLLIRKRTFVPDAGNLVDRGVMSTEMADFLGGCVVSHESIGVTGKAGSYVNMMVEYLRSLAAGNELVVTVEDLPMLGDFRSPSLRLHCAIGNSGTLRPSDLLERAEEFAPDWLVVNGLQSSDLDVLFNLAAGRGGIIAGLPLCGGDSLSMQITTALAFNGTTPTAKLVGQVLSAAFDTIIQMGRDSSGNLRVLKISRISKSDGSEKEMFGFDEAGEGGFKARGSK